jgi:hypothetical protein
MIHIKVKQILLPTDSILAKIFFVQHKQAVEKVLGHLFLSFLPRIGVRAKLQQESSVFMKIRAPASRPAQGQVYPVRGISFFLSFLSSGASPWNFWSSAAWPPE